jgi:hypothetical protein
LFVFLYDRIPRASRSKSRAQVAGARALRGSIRVVDDFAYDQEKKTRAFQRRSKTRMEDAPPPERRPTKKLCAASRKAKKISAASRAKQKIAQDRGRL